MLNRLLLFLLLAGNVMAETPRELSVGRAGHAFEHLGNIAEQGEAAAASGSTIIYATGFGGYGYTGLPPESELIQQKKNVSDYVRRAKKSGIRVAIGYVCATSIVKLDTFDRNWTDQFRAQFSSPPSQWLQVDKNGKPLPSWYGGDYRPACMNNPDWIKYEKAIVQLQLESGHDGIFFDNPTVHGQGCYCEFCMKKWRVFLDAEKRVGTPSPPNSISGLREATLQYPKEFLRFRCTTAREFLREIRQFARTIKPDALITCNNSLNAPESFYAQSRGMAYNIYEMSKTEDLVVVEDMNTQPRILPGGSTLEYGPIYELLQAISHGKPVVAVTVAQDDYHTAPNLVRLAMAEAAAHRASYLSWPTWPENVRAKMITSIRPQADLLRNEEKILNETTPRADVLIFLPFRRWLDTDDCAARRLAMTLTQANVPFEVVCEDDFQARLKKFKTGVLLLESRAVLNADERKSLDKLEATGRTVVTAEKPNWLAELQGKIAKPSLALKAPATIRAVVADQSKKTIVHLYNLNVQRLSSFEDKVTPASDIAMKVRVPFSRVHSVQSLSADDNKPSRRIEFQSTRDGSESVVEIKIPEVKVSRILVIQ
jgi:hypothetical protein